MTDFSAPLRRSRNARMLGGVMAGLAKYLGVDVALVRIAFVVLSVCTTAVPGVLIYAVAWILIPEETQDDSRVVSVQ